MNAEQLIRLPRRVRFAAALALGLAPACASYTYKTRIALADFEAGRFTESERLYDDPETTGAPFLQGVESGTSALSDGRWQDARAHYEAAYEVVREIEDRALVSAEDLGESLLSFAINDTVKDYSGEGYERVMLHSCLAMTYLAEGKLGDVYVEARRANMLLEAEETLYQRQYQAGGLGHFVSALAYEQLGEPAEAYIDYRRMADKGVGVELAGKALVRLARQLGRTEELAALEAQYGDVPSPAPDSACIVVIAGVGLGPYKEEITITLPGPDGVIQWSVPSLVSRYQPVSCLSLSVGASPDSVRTVVIEDVSTVAKQNLDDRIAWLAAKSAVRATLKYALTKELYDDQSTSGLIAGILFTVITEHADLRAWLTLPNTWQASRSFLPAGRHELRLTAEGGESVDLGTWALDPGETQFILVRTLGTRVYAHVLGGDPIAPDVDAPPEVPTPAAAPRP